MSHVARTARHCVGHEFSTRVNPGCAISAGSSSVHKITAKDVAGAPSTSAMSVALMAWMTQRCKAAGGARMVLMAYNAP
jgi:hypothetical protein